MNRYTFSTQSDKAYYFNSIPDFIKDKSTNIVGQLVHHSFEITKEQSDAWENQISELQTRLKSCGMDGDIIFEYDIVRLGKRIDVILLIKHMVFSLEFKNGKKIFTAQDAQQAEDYAIDIKNFHKESENLYVCPILVATAASPWPGKQQNTPYTDKQIHLQRENIETLIPKIDELIHLYGNDEHINFDTWFNSPYHPTPTIIAAAVEAYKSHDISEIANSEAGQKDINSCETAIFKIIEYAKNNKKKCICFVTGVPGAGKTLVGLDVVSKSLKQDQENLSVYLSGNGPLVQVLRAALKKSVKTNKKLDSKTESAINALIQSSYTFKKDNIRTKNPTAEKILIFDEAQRVWNAQKMSSKHKDDPELSISEPKFMYQVMDRHQDWAVMICLVGLGQDIYDGEVGINEWFRIGIEEFTEWELFYSQKMFCQSEDKAINSDSIQTCPRCHNIQGLHLKTSIRSFRADKQSLFVDSLLDNRPEDAKAILQEIQAKYPVYLSRDINKAKTWAKMQVRGSQRCGVLACSSAQRLKPEGVFVPKDIDVEQWFLAPSDDLRSSNMMEVVASEFKVQGLEIDWAVVCWDADLRRKNSNEWDYYRFRSPHWEQQHKPEQKRYLVNSYRVLLTRARQGMVIFVPRGVPKDEDKTRDAKLYNDIYNYLLSCGIQDLTNVY